MGNPEGVPQTPPFACAGRCSAARRPLPWTCPCLSCCLFFSGSTAGRWFAPTAWRASWSRRSGRRRLRIARAVGAFAFKNDEHGFARELLARKTELWLFRTNQQAFCGNFVVVDVSSPRPPRRRAFVLDLKQGAGLRPGGGGAGVQFRNAPRVVRELALATRALDAEAPFERLSGDAGLILAFLGARAPR